MTVDVEDSVDSATVLRYNFDRKRAFVLTVSGSKKGIVEVADAIVVNKSDGELEK